MQPGFDHLTVVVDDLAAAEKFFGLLGFAPDRETVVSGEEMSAYMGIAGWEADHVTLRLDDPTTRQEVQLLRFHSPRPNADPGAGHLDRMGFNHVCFRVRDLEATLATVVAAGIEPRSAVMEFHDRKLVLLDGPGIVVELAQWVTDGS